MSFNLRTGAIVLAVLVLIILAAYAFSGSSSSSAEPSAQATTTAPVPKDPLIGMWRSTDDAKYTREFSASGALVDRYSGNESATQNGTWKFVNPAEEATGVPAGNLAGMKVIKVTFTTGDTMYFGVSALSEGALKLVNLSGRGNILSFVKVK